MAFLFWWSLRRPTPLREPLLTRLTSDSGLTTDAVISPDGKLIAYASDRGGNNLDIYVRQVSGGDPIQLTQDPADDHQPSFSPDGGQIVFRSEREGGGIYIISALGGEERLLTSKGRNPRFSPAGDWIAFWVGPVAGYPLGAQAGKIFLIPPTGGNPKQIDPPGILAAGCPIWSPDGTHLLFYGSDSSNLAVWFPTSDWWVWPLAGGNAVKTGAFAAFAAQNISLTLPSLVPAPAEWMDDRVFFSAKAGDSVSLWQVSISPKNWRITGPAHRLTTGSGLDIRPSFAKTGLLVFSSLVENADIWSLPIDASQGRVKGPPEQLTHDLAADYLPSMSADGKKLAFVSWRSGNPDIWMKDLESGKEKPLTESPAKEIPPRISPDGSLVSYAIRTPGPRKQYVEAIYVIPAKGGLLQKLCDGGGHALGLVPRQYVSLSRAVSRKPSHSRHDQPCHSARLAIIFNLPSSRCFTPHSLTMAAGLLFALWTGRLRRSAWRCWSHPFSVILLRKRVTGSGRQRPALERQTALVAGWKPHLLCLGSRWLYLPLDAARGARNQAALGATSAPLPHPPGTALDTECWLRPHGYCGRTRQDCVQPG